MNNEALAHNVRGWVHYDNMVNALNKQTTNARKQRDDYEKEIQILLNQHQMQRAVIQVSGGRLQLQDEKVTGSFTMKSLMDSTQSFFHNHPEIPNRDKLATDFLQYIKDTRQVTTVVRLKKLKPETPIA
jgi:hypothetical protein